jgi:hypothetical protein
LRTLPRSRSPQHLGGAHKYPAAALYPTWLVPYAAEITMTNEWLTVSNAARILGVSKQAIRQRIYRETIQHRKATDGTVYVRITEHNLSDNGESHAETPGVTQPVNPDRVNPDRVNPDREELVHELRDRIGFLERQLENEQRAHAELRRLFAGALERIPAIEEALPEARESPTKPSDRGDGTQPPPEPEKRSPKGVPWWRRWFGS